ncbi:MAG: AAA-type ATPase lid domain-containing protein [Planctomycetota bacterium]
MRYDWPGNVRELGNAIQHAYVFCRDETIEPHDLPPELLDSAVKSARAFPTLQEAIGRHVEKALELSGGVKTRAAQMLAVDPKTLRRMRRRYHLA